MLMIMMVLSIPPSPILPRNECQWRFIVYNFVSMLQIYDDVCVSQITEAGNLFLGLSKKYPVIDMEIKGKKYKFLVTSCT
jgi:hypothetical protein